MAQNLGPTATLLCWHSQGHGIEALLDTLRLLREREIQIRHVIYLLQSDLDRAARDKVPAGIELTPMVTKLSDPTIHKKIYDEIKRQVLPRLQDFPGPLHINVSPGTPAMHTVWLLLHAGGAFPEDTQLWSSQKPQGGRSRIEPVDFEISTYLREIRRSAAARPEEARYDPESASPMRRAALEQLARYAQLRGAPLLLLGERGTGKSRLCETLVAKLKRKTKVVTVPCGTLDPALAMSLLFGHVKGAFTGADRDKTGYIDEAKNGLLFLDEVQDLPKQVQRQLVRFLQDPHRRYRPVGSQEEKKTDIEVVCASHLSLAGLRERVDADLFDRLSLLIVEIPPLRSCREDTREDFRRVWRELRSQQDIEDTPPWTPDIERALREAPLASNLRDLQRLALLIMAEGSGRLTSSAINSAVSAWRMQQERLRTEDPTPDAALLQEGDTWDSAVARMHAALAREARVRFGSNTKAAEALGVTDRTLRKYLRAK